MTTQKTRSINTPLDKSLPPLCFYTLILCIKFIAKWRNDKRVLYWNKTLLSYLYLVINLMSLLSFVFFFSNDCPCENVFFLLLRIFNNSSVTFISFLFIDLSFYHNSSHDYCSTEQFQDFHFSRKKRRSGLPEITTNKKICSSWFPFI